MVLNCANCGAPIESNKKACPYCKTPYGFRTKIELESYFDSNGRLCRPDKMKIIKSVKNIGGNEPEMIDVTTLEEHQYVFIRGRRENV